MLDLAAERKESFAQGRALAAIAPPSASLSALRVRDTLADDALFSLSLRA
jgi:hypothetical protein